MSGFTISQAALPVAGHNMIAASASAGYAAITGYYRTVGNRFLSPKPGIVSAVDFYAIYSGSGTDVYSVSAWSNGVRTSASARITATGLYRCSFATPVSVAAYDVASVGVYCTTSARYTNSTATGYFALDATNRVTPLVVGNGFFYSTLGAYADGDTEPTLDGYAYGNIFGVDPVFSFGNGSQATDVTTNTIVFDGDSFTVPLLVDPITLGFPTLVASALGRNTVANAAVGGQRIDEMTARFATYVAPSAVYSPKPILVVEGGYNDLIAGASPATLYSRFAAYVSAARAAGYNKIVFLLMMSAPGGAYINPATYETYRTQFNAMVIAGGLVDATVNFDGTNIPRDADLLHPNAAGHAAMAPLIIAAIQGLS